MERMRRYWVVLLSLLFILRDAGAQVPESQFWALNQCNTVLAPGSYPPAIFGAYSTRLVRCNYKGPCIRARHAGNGARGDVSFYNGQIHANSTVTVTTAGGAWTVGQQVPFSTFYAGTDVTVITWYDQSGNGNNASNTGATAKIVIAGNLITENRYPTIEFAGTVQGTISPNALQFLTAINPASVSVFAVYRIITGGTTISVAEGANGSSGFSLPVNTYNSTGRLGVTKYTVVDLAATPAITGNTTSLDVACWAKANSATNTFEVYNRTTAATAVNAAFANASLNLIQIYGEGSNTSKLHLSELFILGYPTAQQRNFIFNHQRAWFNTP